MASGMLVVFGLGMFGTLSTLPLFLENLMDYPSSEAGLVMAPQGIASFCAMALFSQIGGKVPARWVVLTGLILAATGASHLAGLTLEIAPINVVAALACLGFGTGLFFVSMSTMAYQTIDPARTSEAAALYNFSRTIGQSIGISIASTIQARQAQIAWNELGGHIDPFNLNFSDWLAIRGLGENTPMGMARVAQLLEAQSELIAFNHTFAVIALSFFVLMPAALLLRSNKTGARPAPAH